MRYRAVLFDAGGTLLFLDHERIAGELSAACGVALTKADFDAAAPAAALALERSDGTDQARAVRYLESLCRGAGVPAGSWEEARAALFRMHRSRHLWSAGDSRTAPALARLRRAGARLGVVSNSDGRVGEALEAAGLRTYFDVVVDSADAGVEKPDPRIFLLALEQLGIAPAEALHVGDVREVDVAGARRAGLAAALVGPGAVGDAEVRAAATVADLVDSLLAEDRGAEPRDRGAAREPSSSSHSNTSA